MKALRLTAALGLVLAALTVLTEARYRFEIGVLTFSNPSNKDSNGENCDPFGDTVCEYVFRFCYSDQQGGPDNCNFHSLNTEPRYITSNYHTFTLDQPLIPGFNDIPNPIIFNDVGGFADGHGYPWPGGFRLRIQVEDYDELSIDPNDLIDSIIIDQSLSPSANFTTATDYNGQGGRVTMMLQFRALCLTNYYGSDCRTFCQGRDDSSGHYTCDDNGDIVCLDGFTDTSTNCVTPACDPSCVNGECTGPNTCTCSTGWIGTLCDMCELATDCHADRATCNVPGECNCNPGYSGTLCQNDDDVCGHTTPCVNNGTCSNTGPNDYTCECTAGYTGTNCDTEIDGCDPAPCENGGICMNTGPGQFNCTCSTGWTGTTCEDDIDECDPNPPCVHGNCTNCVPTGTTVSDPSNLDFVPCPHGYRCTCLEGFFGDNCDLETDFCVSSPCENEGICEDVVGGPGYRCICPDGYTGTNCETDIDECEDMPCLNGGSCTNLIGSYNCSCPAGFLGDNCQTDIDDCENATCIDENTQNCVDGPNMFTCVCKSGYTGALCDTEIDNCDPNPCQNGSCTNLFNDFSCDCYTGFTGVECDVDIDYCLTPEVCLNGGTCVDGETTFTCDCPPNYTGAQCNTPFNPCTQNPCSSGQGCIEDSTATAGYTCEDCSLISEDSTITATGCTPSIDNPDLLHGNATTPVDGPLIGGVIGGIIGAILLLLLLICLIVCCVRFCVCCLGVKQKETDSTDYRSYPDNAVQDNPLYLGANTLVSSQSGTLRSAYGSTMPRVGSPTHATNPTYEQLAQSSGSSLAESNIDLGPVQNPMYAMTQSSMEKNSNGPTPPPRNGSATGDAFVTDKVSFLPVPSTGRPPSFNHYETIPALANGQQLSYVTSGTYDRLVNEPTPPPDPSFVVSGKYDSLEPVKPAPNSTDKPGKYDSLSVQQPPVSENPYILSPPQRENPPELTMTPSERGDMYVMLPPTAAFASLKEEAKSEKETKDTIPEHAMPQSKENPYEFN